MLEKFKEDYEMFHSSFQIENFILIKNGKTTYGIYKQCLRELISRETSLRSVYAQKLRLDIDYEELCEKIKKEEDLDANSYTAKRLRIDQAELAYGMKDLLKVISETEREYTHFYNAGVILKEELGELPKEKRHRLEQQLWIDQCKYKACTDIRFTGRISVETLGLIDSLPNEKKQSLNSFFLEIQGGENQHKINAFISEYSKNFEFKERLDLPLKTEVKKLVENNGS